MITRCLLASHLFVLGIVSAQPETTVSTELVDVVERPLEGTIILPGELLPFQSVEIHAKVTGFVESVGADRGSRVSRGEQLATMTAPELVAQGAQAQARLSNMEAQRAAAESTYQRLKQAAKTPGVVAGNDVVLAEKALQGLLQSVAAAEAALRSIEAIQKYLQITAPFNGVITERYAHVGSLVGPAGSKQTPLFRIEQIHRLRLVAPVPEAYAESIERGRKVSFTVPAHPGRTFDGVVSRPAYSMDPNTRTMPVELDVNNASGRLSPGMYAEIAWPIRRAQPSLFVPPSAIRSTTERVFVIRVDKGRAEWVDVRRGAAAGSDLVEVFGDLHAGDKVVLRATDEIRPGTRLQPRP